MTSDVVLTAAMRNNLLSLQGTQSSIDGIQNRLATGLKVASALDNPQNFFASESLKNRAGDLTRLLDAMGQSIQTVKAADKGVTGITKLIGQAESIISSAEEAITTGQVEAAITGNVNLKGVKDLTTLAGVSATDVIRITYYDTPNTAPTHTSTASIAIAANQSIDQLITAINDIENGDVFKAELTSQGFLKITELQGKAFNIQFSEGAVDTALEPADLALAAGLGFGDKVEAVRVGAAAVGAYEATVLASTKLESGVFYTNAAGTLAKASDLLTASRTTDGGATSRFTLVGASTSLNLTINGKTTINVGLNTTQTIQGLVDGINTAAANTGLIKASYDDTTGKLSITATSQTVQQIHMNINETTAAPVTADFDFGVKGAWTTAGAANDQAGESFRFANAAATLAQYEKDYNDLLTQIDEMASNSGYRGVNLLGGDSLTTYFDENRVSKLTLTGATLSSAGLALNQADFSTATRIEGVRTEVLAAKASVRSFGSTLANGLSIIQIREDFTKGMVNTLVEGSGKLTTADQNEEGAKLLALQTRQQLGVISLSMASQAQQAVLRLF